MNNDFASRFYINSYYDTDATTEKDLIDKKESLWVNFSNNRSGFYFVSGGWKGKVYGYTIGIKFGEGKYTRFYCKNCIIEKINTPSKTEYFVEYLNSVSI